jgi:hypothetical protein
MHMDNLNFCPIITQPPCVCTCTSTHRCVPTVWVVEYESVDIRALSSLTGRVTGSYDLANDGSLILQR